MKSKSLIITTIIFFLVVNTTYFWEGKLGIFAFPAFLLLIIIYFGLAIALIIHLYLAIKEKFDNKTRLLCGGILATVLTLTFFKPFGLIDFDNLEGNDILIAKREGAANCMTTLKLKDDYTFRERDVCFGLTEIKGTYYFKNDTIYFDNVEHGRHENDFYKFAIIKKSPFSWNNEGFELYMFTSIRDTTGHYLTITKNDIKDYDPL